MFIFLFRTLTNTKFVNKKFFKITPTWNSISKMSTSDSSYSSSSSSSSSEPPPKKHIKNKPSTSKKSTKKQTKPSLKSSTNVTFPVTESSSDGAMFGSPSTKQESSKISIKEFENDREKTAKSIVEFKFIQNRIRILSTVTETPESTKGICYWMSRDVRVQDNWAFLYAQKIALKNHVPLHVCYCLVPKFLDATIRHYKFLLAGLEEVSEECQKLNIQFHLLIGQASIVLPQFVQDNQIGGVICDFSPLRVPIQWVNDVKEKLPKTVAFCQVDAHNIVPVWVTSTKQEYAARTIRNKINSKLDLYLTKFPPIIKHPFDWDDKKNQKKKIDWTLALASVQVDRTVDQVDWAKPGYKSAVNQLESFCGDRIKLFNTKRNDPTVNALSNLSPWFHFGHISVQRCILTVQQLRKRYPDSVAAFCEEAIVRRELSDNFCFYNEHYDSLKGCSSWAYDTLMAHKKDKREWLYTKQELETSKTHDDLWNSAQIQLCSEGKLHGFLRMYWAKKILEWSDSPEQALATSIYLNDKYSLDGRDPNGYVGCMWSIGGIHDMGWKERSIFGKIRYMNYQGCKRKFDVPAFVARYGGKIYDSKKKSKK